MPIPSLEKLSLEKIVHLDFILIRFDDDRGPPEVYHRGRNHMTSKPRFAKKT